VAELPPGATLTRYRIISKIGAGGMGEVYQAQDIELGRPVALKFLPDEVASHQNRLTRFIQEAKAASALNHPNILTVYEIGRADNSTFIATEFIDGTTLRRYLRLQRLKLIEVLDIAAQIASALVAAHAAGIVHRDIKPENIMVRTDGFVKVLDFGLAKLTENRDSSGPEASTMALVNTEPGAILGTTASMSPEQAAGREVDARSDIWSLGVVLYEMIAARTPFEGASKSHIIVAITDHDPRPITQFVPDVPESLEWIIAEALTKDREERCQTAKEMLGKLRRLKQRIESGALPTSPSDLNRSVSPSSLAPATNSNVVSLAEKGTTLPEVGRSTAPSEDAANKRVLSSIEFVAEGIKQNRKAAIALLVIGVLFAGVIGFAIYKLFNQPKQFGPAKMTALTTGGKVNGEDINGQVAISPDGKYVVVVFISTRTGTETIWRVGIDGGTPVQLTNQASQLPSITPDGKLISYFYTDEQANNQPRLALIPFAGGETVKTIDLPRTVQPIAFAWMPDGKSIAYLDSGSGILNIWSQPIDGGAPKQLTNFKSEFITSFAISSDGKIAAYRWSATRDIVLIKGFR
jgi:serine/threonine protein kinase